MKIKEPLIIDIEASSLSSNSHPIEIGLALEDGNRFCTLIKPSPNWTDWDLKAEATHNIHQQTLAEHGKPVTEVAQTLNTLLAGRTLYSDGWVVDKPWLSKLFYAAKISMNFEVQPLEMILSEPQMEKWHQVKEKVTQQSGLQRHRASNDAWIIQQTYRLTAE